MVKIRRGSHVLTVTNGAFKSLYAPMGYVVVETEGDAKVPRTPDEVTTTPDATDSSEDDSEGTEDDSEPEDEPEDDELEEKPISEMSFKELKEYASRHGLNVNGLSSKQEIRRALKNAGI